MKLPLLLSTLPLWVAFTPIHAAWADSPTLQGQIPLAQQAKEILRQNCFGCHGDDGHNSGNIGSVLNDEDLIKSGTISAGNPDSSDLIVRVRSREMPLGDIKLGSDQIDILKSWIQNLPQTASGGVSGVDSPASADSSPAKLSKVTQTKNATRAVLEHHADRAHSGAYVDPNLTRENAQSLKYDGTFVARIDGPSYSQPLYVNNAVGKGRDVVLVTTEKNMLYAFDAKTGNTLWSRNVGNPVSLASLPCGNIDPLGITGTPAVSPSKKNVYFDAMVTPDGGATKQHKIFAFSVRDGSVAPGFPMDVQALLKTQGAQFNPENQNQRAAVSIVGDRAYFGFGGHFGDCGDFRGWVVGVPLNGDQSGVRYWSTSALNGGVWAPGGIVSDGKSIYFSTGNTDETKQWSGGEAVIRLDKNLKLQGASDYFSPSNWKELDDDDDDIGGVAPVLVDLPTANPAKLVVAMGKNGVMYLIDRENLGGIGHEVASQTVSSPMITAPAVYTIPSGTYIVFKGKGVGCPAGQSGNLTAVKLVPGPPPLRRPTMQVAWCSDQGGSGSPIVSTTNGVSDSIIWSLGAEGDNKIHAFNAETGKSIFTSAVPGSIDAPPEGEIARFQTPILVKGQLYLIMGNRLIRYVSSNE